VELTRESESEKSRGAYMKLFHLQEGGLIEYKPRWILYLEVRDKNSKGIET